jgi:hypothetical protein
MRKWIDLMEEKAEPEWYRYLGMFFFNIDLARKMIASGEVHAKLVQMPVKNCYQLLGLDKDEYGSNEFTDDFDSRGINPLSAIQKRSTMKGMPDDKLNEPALVVMWNAADAMGRVGLKFDKGAEGEYSKPSPILIDGNHRLGRLYLEGAESATAYLIPHEEALKFCFDRYSHPLLRDASFRR